MANTSLPKAIQRMASAPIKALLLKQRLIKAYAAAVNDSSTNIAGVLFVDENTSTMSPATQAAFLELQYNWDIDVRFIGLARTEGYGWDSFLEVAELAARMAASNVLVVTDETCDFARTLASRIGERLINLPIDSNEKFASSLAKAIATRSNVGSKKATEDFEASSDAKDIDISFVVPAFNSDETLERAINSILVQSYPLKRLEVIIVDDCSNDKTLEIAQALAGQYPELIRVIQTPAQSGTPAAPRNLGIMAATGAYVFFLDSDDWLETDAAERMMRHALDWDSDILLVKPVGEGGREVPSAMFGGCLPEASLSRSKICWTLSPLKLFRRSLVQDLRFPENCMPEDISFVLRAFSRARVISVAADGNYYHVAAEKGKENASVTTWDDAESNLRAYEDIFGILAEDGNLASSDALLRRLFKRDVCATLHTIAREKDDKRAKHLKERLRIIVGPFYDPKRLRTLSEDDLMLLHEALS